MHHLTGLWQPFCREGCKETEIQRLVKEIQDLRDWLRVYGLNKRYGVFAKEGDSTQIVLAIRKAEAKLDRIKGR